MPGNDNPQARRFLESMAKHGEEEAGLRFAQEHPLAKSADLGRKSAWAKELCAFLHENYDDAAVRAIRMDCACGPSNAFIAKLRALYQKDKDPYGFVERVNRLDLGLTLEYDGASYCLLYPECYCSCVKRAPEPLPAAWCYCTLGYTKRMFEGILGKGVQAELLGSVKMGDAACRIKIIVQGQ